MRIIRQGDDGSDVRDVQQRLLALGLSIDPDELEGRFGHSTEEAVRAFQRRRRLPADGLVGPDTWGQLVEAGWSLGDRTLYLRAPSFRGDDVRDLQRLLNALGFDAGREDGILGERTDAAVRDFQRNVGDPGDGIVGPGTIAALRRLRPALGGPSRAVVREEEALRTMSASIRRARIAIDPGHGPGDPGHVGPAGSTEAAITLSLARSLADELEARGARPSLLRDEDDDQSLSDRARMANELRADLCLSLHLNGGPPACEGATCSYFGSGSTHSPAGRRLAELIQEQLTGGLGLADGRTHPLALTMLRETRMPAVQIEPCYLTNPDEEQLLADATFRTGVAVAIASGVERFLAGSESAPTEGS